MSTKSLYYFSTFTTASVHIVHATSRNQALMGKNLVPFRIPKILKKDFCLLELSGKPAEERNKIWTFPVSTKFGSCTYLQYNIIHSSYDVTGQGMSWVNTKAATSQMLHKSLCQRAESALLLPGGRMQTFSHNQCQGEENLNEFTIVIIIIAIELNYSYYNYCNCNWIIPISHASLCLLTINNIHRVKWVTTVQSCHILAHSSGG